jgi:hypothetical protein
MVEDSEAKRRRIEDEQRAAFEEDMARIRAAMGTQNASSNDDAGGQSQATAGEPTSEQGSQLQQHASSILNRSRADSDDEGEGNWLKSYTPHHTRIGADYQVTDLPTPSRKGK